MPISRDCCGSVDVIVDDVLLVSDEFSAFEDARRRVDLLGADHEGRLVVFELKWTTEGGQLELQALRYAAMGSVMTFDDLAERYARYLAQVDPLRSTTPGPGWRSGRTGGEGPTARAGVLPVAPLPRQGPAQRQVVRRRLDHPCQASG